MKDDLLPEEVLNIKLQFIIGGAQNEGYIRDYCDEYTILAYSNSDITVNSFEVNISASSYDYFCKKKVAIVFLTKDMANTKCISSKDGISTWPCQRFPLFYDPNSVIVDLIGLTTEATTASMNLTICFDHSRKIKFISLIDNRVKRSPSEIMRVIEKLL